MNCVRDLRKSRHMKQEDLANALGVSRSTIAGWESQRCNPRGNTLKDLEILFNTPARIILQGNLTLNTATYSDCRHLIERLQEDHSFRDAVQVLYRLSSEENEKVLPLLQTLEGILPFASIQPNPFSASEKQKSPL